MLCLNRFVQWKRYGFSQRLISSDKGVSICRTIECHAMNTNENENTEWMREKKETMLWVQRFGAKYVLLYLMQFTRVK